MNDNEVAIQQKRIARYIALKDELETVNQDLAALRQFTGNTSKVRMVTSIRIVRELCQNDPTHLSFHMDDYDLRLVLEPLLQQRRERITIEINKV